MPPYGDISRGAVERGVGDADPYGDMVGGGAGRGVLRIAAPVCGLVWQWQVLRVRCIAGGQRRPPLRRARGSMRYRAAG